jgi:hypothetical protein
MRGPRRTASRSGSDGEVRVETIDLARAHKEPCRAEEAPQDLAVPADGAFLAVAGIGQPGVAHTSQRSARCTESLALGSPRRRQREPPVSRSRPWGAGGSRICMRGRRQSTSGACWSARRTGLRRRKRPTRADGSGRRRKLARRSSGGSSREGRRSGSFALARTILWPTGTRNRPRTRGSTGPSLRAPATRSAWAILAGQQWKR